jgi:hypothetical protein
MMTRREMLRRSGLGFGHLALAGVLAAPGRGKAAEVPRPHFSPRAKRVIFLYMHGGPSQVLRQYRTNGIANPYLDPDRPDWFPTKPQY